MRLVNASIMCLTTAAMNLPKSSLSLPIRTVSAASTAILGPSSSCRRGGGLLHRLGPSPSRKVLMTTQQAAPPCQQRRHFVSLHGTNPFSTTAIETRNANDPSKLPLRPRPNRNAPVTAATAPPPDPNEVLSSEEELQERIEQVVEWMRTKSSVLCVTGAGISTEPGVPDYRGHDGAYLRGHKPMLHGEFVSSHRRRQRYWGRGMVGWRSFQYRQPNRGHQALAALERIGRLGVTVNDSPDYYRDGDDDLNFAFGTGQRTLSIVTQNVDSLHQRAGSQHVLELHGRTDQLRCMHCGAKACRNDFHDELERINAEWLAKALSKVEANSLRPDGDAETGETDYSEVQVPGCPSCTVGFVKPDVVFFGDTVPKHRVALCAAAVEHADGLLVVGTSLAVHSAFRHVRAASQRGIPICVVNVGETRAEAEGLQGILKVEAPAGPTLSGVAEHFSS